MRFRFGEMSGRVQAVLLLAALATLFLILRIPALEADPAATLPYGINKRELWAEGAAKAHEARNYALYGAWRTNPVDNYQFWRPQAPVWVYSLAAVFKVFGVSIFSARMHSVAAALLGFLATLIYGRERLSKTGLLAVGVFLGVNHLYIQYTRVGLVEPMVSLFAALTLYTAYRALDDPRWLFSATVACLLGVFTKMSGMVVMPLLFLCAIASLRRSSLSPRQKLEVLVPSLVLLLSAALYMTSAEYRQRAIWAVAHMGYAQEGQTEINAGKLEPLAILVRYVTGQRWHERFFLLSPIAAVFCLPAIVHTARQFWRSRRLGWDELSVLWLFATHASLQLSPLTDMRFYLCLFPPLALVGARGLDIMLGWVGRLRGAAPGLACAALAASVLTELPRHVEWFQNRSFGVRDANQLVAKKLGPRDDVVIVGMWAPWLTLETPYKFYVVRDNFNVRKEALARLGVTHLLLARGDRSGNFVKKGFPRQFRSKRALGSFKVYKEHITLYELVEPLAAPDPR